MRVAAWLFLAFLASVDIVERDWVFVTIHILGILAWCLLLRFRQDGDRAEFTQEMEKIIQETEKGPDK